MKDASGAVLDAHGRVMHAHDLAALSRGTRMLSGDGGMVNTISALNAVQAKDFVDAARCRRFWVFKTEEERRQAAANNHDCCAGSLLLIKVGLMHMAIARVVRQQVSNAVHQTLKLEPGSLQVTFKLELCLFEETTVEDEDGLEQTVCCFRSSGRQLPVCTGARVIQLVSRKSLLGICGQAYDTISRPDLTALLQVGRQATSPTATWLSAAQLTGVVVLDCPVRLPDSTLCFNCHQGWADESSGPLLPCLGDCKRAFHTGFYPNFLPFEKYGLCAGTDTVACCVCHHEWSDPCKESDFYTGLLVECEGDCNRHFHQKCHVVPILDAATLPTAPPFLCADCKAGHRPDSASQQPPSSQPTTMPDVAEAPPSLEDAPMGDAPSVEEDGGEEGEVEGEQSGIPSAAITLTLTRGVHGKLGMHVLAVTNVVESVARGSAAEKAGVQPGDHVVGVGGRYLSQFLQFAQLLPIGQIGSTLTLSVLRAPTQTATPPLGSATSGADCLPARKRARPVPADGMSSLEGVRIQDGHGRTRTERMSRTFEENTSTSL